VREAFWFRQQSEDAHRHRRPAAVRQMRVA
jgi:hypothetical protein